MRSILITPKAGEADEASLRQALLDPPKADASVRLASAPISFDQMPAIGQPGRVAAIVPTGILNIEQIEFENGVKAMI